MKFLSLKGKAVSQGWPSRPASGATLKEATIGKRCTQLLMVAMLSKRRKYGNYNRGQSGKKSLYLWREIKSNIFFLKRLHH
jgi:hypothetical protein